MADEDDYDSPWSSWNGQQSTVGGTIGVETPAYDPTKSFDENGGDSLTALSTLLELRKQGHTLTIEDFFAANNFKTAANASLNSTISSLQNNLVFIKKDIKDLPKQETIAVIAECFVRKGDLERCRVDLQPADMEKFLHRVWDVLQKFSFGYVDEDGKIKAVATMVDLVEMERFNVSLEELHPHIGNVFPYLDYITQKVHHDMPAATEPGILMEKFMFATNVNCTPSENVVLMNMLEVEFHERCRKAGYTASFAQNASPLTQQLAELMGCKRLLTDNPREYVNSAGERPFVNCAEGTRVTIDLMVYSDK